MKIPIYIYHDNNFYDQDGSEPSEIILKKVNFRATGIYRCEITSSKYFIVIIIISAFLRLVEAKLLIP